MVSEHKADAPIVCCAAPSFECIPRPTSAEPARNGKPSAEATPVCHMALVWRPPLAGMATVHMSAWLRAPRIASRGGKPAMAVQRLLYSLSSHSSVSTFCAGLSGFSIGS